jgi:hypothetical protein
VPLRVVFSRREVSLAPPWVRPLDLDLPVVLHLAPQVEDHQVLRQDAVRPVAAGIVMVALLDASARQDVLVPELRPVASQSAFPVEAAPVRLCRAALEFVVRWVEYLLVSSRPLVRDLLLAAVVLRQPVERACPPELEVEPAPEEFRVEQPPGQQPLAARPLEPQALAPVQPVSRELQQA